MFSRIVKNEVKVLKDKEVLPEREEKKLSLEQEVKMDLQALINKFN